MVFTMLSAHTLPPKDVLRQFEDKLEGEKGPFNRLTSFMTERDWQTGKGCCLDGMRGQLSPLGPVFNKVPINSPFISDRNQCSSDWVSQLTLLTGRPPGLTKEKTGGKGSERGRRGQDRKGYTEQKLLLVFSFSRVERPRGAFWEQRCPHPTRTLLHNEVGVPMESAAKEVLTENSGRLSPRRKCVCATGCR